MKSIEPKPVSPRAADIRVDAEIGHRLIEVKPGLTAVRNLRASLVQLACATAARPHSEGILLLPYVAVTRDRLEREWQFAASVLPPGILDRLSLCIGTEAPFDGIPRVPDPETQRILSEVLAQERAVTGVNRTRGDARSQHGPGAPERRLAPDRTREVRPARE